MELLRYTTKTEITNYYPVPRSLLSRNLPVTALLIYGILLDRATLSRKNGYCNDGGWIFVLYTQQELAELLGISPRMVGRYIRNLKDAGLLCPVRKTRKAATSIIFCCRQMRFPEPGQVKNVMLTGQICQFRPVKNVCLATGISNRILATLINTARRRACKCFIMIPYSGRSQDGWRPLTAQGIWGNVGLNGTMEKSPSCVMPETMSPTGRICAGGGSVFCSGARRETGKPLLPPALPGILQLCGIRMHRM
ncbi:MAG: helix-turn-helix domain-containing protein [Oscillospiraceae bacterium]|nr:helix-turn-helix domain-containing protein [Oscillospiraceae bacterium]